MVGPTELKVLRVLEGADGGLNGRTIAVAAEVSQGGIYVQLQRLCEKRLARVVMTDDDKCYVISATGREVVRVCELIEEQRRAQDDLPW